MPQRKPAPEPDPNWVRVHAQDDIWIYLPRVIEMRELPKTYHEKTPADVKKA